MFERTDKDQTSSFRKPDTGSAEVVRVDSHCLRRSNIAALFCLRLFQPRRIRVALSLILSLTLMSGGCFESEEVEPFYGRVVVPRAQEFRWSDGGIPQVFDPALAATPPDTDAVRAMFEGLTDYDPHRLTPVSAVATRWESSTDNRLWTFYLRRDARWSNGDSVTAQDFVRSWKRTLQLGERAPHHRLLENIERAAHSPAHRATAGLPEQSTEDAAASPQMESGATAENLAPTFGAVAVNDHVLKVRLQHPDKKFPALVAHPVFRPVHGAYLKSDPFSLSEGSFEKGLTTLTDIVSNGAFRLSERKADGVVLVRDRNYWDTDSVALDRVRFVAARNAEQSLAAYRAGEVDAVTNAAFEPLAVKLLSPYQDFRRATYGALTFYAFNRASPPFDDLRVRRALALALDRDRLSADTMDGMAEPAKRFLPSQLTSEGSGTDESVIPKKAGELSVSPLDVDVEGARRLLAEAGFPRGERFPRIRLLINRNEQHRVMAQAVASMWRSALGVQTEVIMRGWEEYEAALRSGDYDIARRSVVMQTTDEETNMLAMFEPLGQENSSGDEGEDAAQAESPSSVGAASSPSVRDTASPDEQSGEPQIGESKVLQLPLIRSEADALRELPAIPVYFSSSYALVKPYVSGFDANLLDIPSLKRVRIDTTWKPANGGQMIRIVPNG